MENLIISVNAVLPTFLIIGVGLIVQRAHMLSSTTIRQANNLCINVFVGTMIFCNIYTADMSGGSSGMLLLFCLGGVVLQFLVGLLLFTRIIPNRPTRGVMLQAFFRANAVLLGIPIATSLYGSEGMGPVSVIVAIVVPFINILSVISLEMNRGSKIDPKRLLRGIVITPFVIGAAVGLLLVLLGIRLPLLIEKPVLSIANAATPLALILMGASLNFSNFKHSIRNLSISVICRLVINPAVLIAAAIALGFRGVELCAVLVVFAVPVSVNSYTLSMQLDGDTELAGSIVLVSTALSCFTLCGWVWLLKSFGLL